MAKILIVDDDSQVLAMLEQTLQKAGYDVLTAEDGNEGLRCARENKIDLIITDLVMPDKEGTEMIREIHKEFPDIKIIAMSGGGRIEPTTYLAMAKILGAHFTFTKPVDRQELLKAVRDLLS